MAAVVEGHPDVLDLCEALAAGEVTTLVNWSSLASRDVKGVISQHMEREASEHIGIALMQRVQSGVDSAGLADDSWRVAPD
ncbi:hypothetical protein Y886_08355 [Xanthomonas hyacinthi DSM 19077]|nr:hypothetical protein Y886_08355 [Xanthomonas hyacinthi DSM 19077]